MVCWSYRFIFVTLFFFCSTFEQKNKNVERFETFLRIFYFIKYRFALVEQINKGLLVVLGAKIILEELGI